MASETEMKEFMNSEVMKDLDEEFIASILNDIEISPDESNPINDVPEEKNDLLKMVMDDAIGEDTVAQFCNVDFLTLNTQDITESRENEAMCTSASHTQEATVNIVDANVAPVEKRRGPGRPRKPRTTEKVTKPRGRPARVHLNLQNVMADHHNYSNGGASNQNLSTDERYRRMRDLNNVASQRCRLKRKEKQQAAIDELTQEQEKNSRLR